MKAALPVNMLMEDGRKSSVRLLVSGMRRVTEVRLTPAAPAEDAEKDDEKDKRFSRLAQRGESR